MAINDVRVNITANITVSDEVAERCLRLLEMWQEDNMEKCIVSERLPDGRTVFKIVKNKEEPHD